MRLASGTQLGHYEIASLIGQGGMGEVYRARDTQLKRDVALKVLPPAFSSDPERLARFQREAEVLASLDHPNIAPIFGMVEQDGVRALALALVEGPTLAEHIAKGPMKVDDALNIVKQIIGALEYAHDRGVIHRDLKPANIKITPEGMVKVLDFGLAKVLDDEPPPATGADSPTLTIGHTRAGIILGTAAYMSPEQAVGKPADRRSDIFSLGAVLYEMLTGRRAFAAETAAETLVAVASAEPDWSRLPAGLPRPVDKLLQRCLVKDRKLRLQAIGEGRIILDDPVPVPAPTAPEAVGQAGVPSGPPAAGLQTRFLLAAAALLAISTSVLAFLHFRETPPEARLLRTTILPPDKTSFSPTLSRAPMALSPDGRRIVFAATGEDGKSQLWIRPLDSTTAQPLQGTEGALFPFWSPDSRYVGFTGNGKLKKIDIAGGPALTLADSPNCRGGAWSPEGVILFAPTSNGPLLRVSSAGGAVSPATNVDNAKGVNHRFPWFLPDGKHFLFTSEKPRTGPVATNQAGTNQSVHVGSLDSKDSKVIADSDSNAVYADGFILYMRGETLLAQPFDVKKLETSGEAAPIAERVEHILTPGTRGFFSVSATGLLAFQTGSGVSGLQLAWFDRTGKKESAVEAPHAFGNLSISPDRKFLAAAILDANNPDIYVFDLARGLPARFTFDPAQENDPVWSPDGRGIILSSTRKGHKDLYRKSADGVGTEELLFADDTEKTPSSWSPDGKLLLYTAGQDIWVLPLAPEKPGALLKPYPFLNTPQPEAEAQFSPDGHWVSYTSSDSTVPQIFVMPFPGPGGRRQVSPKGGVRSRWSRDGKEIFYVSFPDGQLTAAEVTVKGNALDVGATHALFGPVSTNATQYDLSADSKHIIAAMAGDAKAAEPITLVQNWTVALHKSRVLQNWALASPYAQSSHGNSARMSDVSTVAPPQIRNPGGASRYAPIS